MDLRDQLAMHFAAALVDAFPAPEEIARRAYDLAEAMLAERARRIDAEEAGAIAGEPRRPSISAPPAEYHGALLDEPYPMPDDEDLDPRLLEPDYDPSWDLDRWSPDDAPAVSPSRPPGPESARPGLARTQPDDAEPGKKERSA